MRRNLALEILLIPVLGRPWHGEITCLIAIVLPRFRLILQLSASGGIALLLRVQRYLIWRSELRALDVICGPLIELCVLISIQLA